jgi:hypothetical protein
VSQLINWLELHKQFFKLWQPVSDLSAVGCGPFDAFSYVILTAIPILVLAECWKMNLAWKFSIPILAIVKTTGMLITLCASNLIMGENLLARSVAHLVAMLDKAGLTFGSLVSSKTLYLCVWIMVLANSMQLLTEKYCLCYLLPSTENSAIM